MAYLLDTCILSHFFRKEGNVIKNLQNHQPNQIKITSITVLEIEYGLNLNPSLKKRLLPLWENFIGQIETLSFKNEDALKAANVRAHLKKLGTPIGSYDLLIGSIALAQNLTMVTTNMKEFERIPDLKIENWL